VDFWGTVSRINPQIDSDNRTFGLEVLIPNDDHRLKAGSFARASVQTHVDQAVVFAPQEAVVTFAGVNKVFTVNEGKAVEVNVDPGDARVENNDYVEISTGLKGNEQVVVSGTSKLATGVPVSIKSSTTQAASKPLNKTE
jgi:RND family efflux transporter MFP subunit